MATLRLCSIPDCGKPAVRQFDWCKDHRSRWERHGDPLGGRVARGAVLKYFHEVVMAYDGDDCLIWPYSTNNGYGQLRWNGRPVIVSRLVCELTHGPAPDQRDNAAHSCGKGHEGCVAKKHLRWKSPADNEADKRIHGTWDARRGGAKLTWPDVRRIRSIATAEPKMPHAHIAAMFGVERRAVNKVVKGETWRE
jgi:hypothetical protein